jgi:tetratricopeptide (TPR) repeat protein
MVRYASRTQDVLALVDQAIESGHGALNWFWDGLPRAERFIMSAVAHVTDETGLATEEDIRRILEKHKIVLTGLELTDAPDRLTAWEMLRREGVDGYRFVVELVRRWILKTHPLESARRDVDLISVRASRMYENARDAHTVGDMAFARDEYRRALTVNPNHSGAQLGLAQVLFELGEIEAAIEAFQKAYNIDEVSARDGLVRARQRLGQTLEEAGQEEEALSQYNQAYRLAPSNETTCRRLAAIWRRRGDLALSTTGLAASFEPYQRALAYDTRDDTAEKIKVSLSQYAEGGGSKSDQDFETAVRAIEQMQALKILAQSEADRRLIPLWLEQGRRRLANAQVLKAIAAYQQVLAHSPDEIVIRSIQDSLTAYVEQAEAQQQYAEAIRAIKQLNVLLPENDQVRAFEAAFWTRLGDSLAQESDKQGKAIQAYKRALELAPDDTSLTKKLEIINVKWENLLKANQIFSKGLIARRDKDWATAEANWLQLLKMDILNYKGHNIAVLLAEAQWEKQIEEKRRAKAQERTDQGQVAEEQIQASPLMSRAREHSKRSSHKGIPTWAKIVGGVTALGLLILLGALISGSVKLPVAKSAHDASFNIRAYDLERDKDTEFSYLAWPEDLEEPTEPGTFPLDMSVPTGKPLLIRVGWCATDEQTLTANWAMMRHELIIDDVEVALNELPVVDLDSDTWTSCQAYVGVVTEWSSGRHSITKIHYIDQIINDGVYTFEAGKYVYVYEITVDVH